MVDASKLTVSVWKMKVSIWKMRVSIWDFLSLCEMPTGDLASIIRHALPL